MEEVMIRGWCFLMDI